MSARVWLVVVLIALAVLFVWLLFTTASAEVPVEIGTALFCELVDGAVECREVGS